MPSFLLAFLLPHPWAWNYLPWDANSTALTCRSDTVASAFFIPCNFAFSFYISLSPTQLVITDQPDNVIFICLPHCSKRFIRQKLCFICHCTRSTWSCGLHVAGIKKCFRWMKIKAKICSMNPRHGYCLSSPYTIWICLEYSKSSNRNPHFKIWARKKMNHRMVESYSSQRWVCCDALSWMISNFHLTNLAHTDSCTYPYCPTLIF